MHPIWDRSRRDLDDRDQIWLRGGSATLRDTILSSKLLLDSSKGLTSVVRIHNTCLFTDSVEL